MLVHAVYLPQFFSYKCESVGITELHLCSKEEMIVEPDINPNGNQGLCNKIIHCLLYVGKFLLSSMGAKVSLVLLGWSLYIPSDPISL